MMSTFRFCADFKAETFTKMASELGFDAIDWVTNWEEKPETLKKLAEDAGLAISAHTFLVGDVVNTSQKALDNFKRSLSEAVIMGAPLIMIASPPHPDINDRQIIRSHWIKFLTQAAVFAEKASMPLTVESFPGRYSPFLSADDFLEAKKEIPYLQLTFDDGNTSLVQNPVEALEKVKDDVIHVHLKDFIRSEVELPDCKLMADGKWYKPALIGEGLVDTRGVLLKLREMNYSGYINLEYEAPDYPPAQALTKAMKYVKDILAQN